MSLSLTQSFKTITKLLIVPFLLAISAYFYFSYSSAGESLELAAKEEYGMVSGAFDERIAEISSAIPIIPGSEILSTDSGESTSSVILEVKERSTTQILSFYSKYLSEKHWEQTGQKTWVKNNKELQIEIENNVVLINLTIL